jgi:hypothetical protein
MYQNNDEYLATSFTTRIFQLLTYTDWMIADAASKEVKPSSPDEHGACSVIQMAIDMGREVHLFICSGLA